MSQQADPASPLPCRLCRVPGLAAGLEKLAETRWERWVVAVFGLAIIALAGARPTAVRDVGQGLSILGLAAEARTAHEDPARAAECWRRVRRYRPRDLAFQEHAAAELFYQFERANLQQPLAALLREPQVRAMLDRGAPRLAYRLARALLDAGQAEEAVAVLRPAVERAATPARRRGVALMLAEALAQTGHAGQAETLVLGLQEAEPDDPALRNALAYHYAITDTHLTEAEQLLQPVLRAHEWQVVERAVSPRDYRRRQANYLDTLAWIRYRQDQLDQAKELLSKAVAMTPDAPNSEILYHLAQVCYDLGDDRQAWDWCQKALAERPRHAEALRLQGLLEGQGHNQLS